MQWRVLGEKTMSTTPEQDVSSGEQLASPTAKNSDEAPSSNEDSDSAEDDGITVEKQMQFGVGGELEPAEEEVEATLDQFDFGISHRDPETKLDRPEASGLMKDDRPEVTSQDGGEQANLFVDMDENQQTLQGDSPQNRCPFESN
jgi:hypothetical protein